MTSPKRHALSQRMETLAMSHIRFSEFLSKNTEQRMVEGAYNWAKANRSDPFALKVALSHIRNGISTPFNGEGSEGFYNAEFRKDEFGRNVPLNMARP